MQRKKSATPKVLGIFIYLVSGIASYTIFEEKHVENCIVVEEKYLYKNYTRIFKRAVIERGIMNHFEKGTRAMVIPFIDIHHGTQPDAS